MRPLVIAHRGASGYLPEHTLAAKALAHEMGADYLEQDVVASRDDVLVVLHDIHLDRVTDVASRFPRRHREDGRYYVRDFDLDEIQSLRVWERMNADGSPVYPERYPPRSGDFRISTLAEEIAFIQKLNAESGRQAGIYPEIKHPAWHREEGIDIAPALLRILAEFGYENRDAPVYLQCFDDTEIRRLRQRLECPFKLVQLIGASVTFKTTDSVRHLAEYADAIGPPLSHLYTFEETDSVPVPNELAGWAHDAGLSVHPYTFRADELPAGFASFEELVAFFADEVVVDGLFTDFPDQVLQLLTR